MNAAEYVQQSREQKRRAEGAVGELRIRLAVGSIKGAAEQAEAAGLAAHLATQAARGVLEVVSPMAPEAEEASANATKACESATHAARLLAAAVQVAGVRRYLGSEAPAEPPPKTAEPTAAPAKTKAPAKAKAAKK